MWFSFISCSSWYDRKNETCSQKSVLQGYFHRSLKTFNCICNHILITQLNAYEFDRNKLKLINDCLNGRSQKNRVFRYEQGSTFGLPLFDMDLFFVDYRSDTFCKFADASRYQWRPAFNEVIRNIEINKEKVLEWFIFNKWKASTSICDLFFLSLSTCFSKCLRFNYWKQQLEHLSITTLHLSIIQIEFATDNFRNAMHCLVLQNKSLKINKYNWHRYWHLKVKNTLFQNHCITISMHKISSVHQIHFLFFRVLWPKTPRPFLSTSTQKLSK